jgi:hypothetical protein
MVLAALWATPVLLDAQIAKLDTAGPAAGLGDKLATFGQFVGDWTVLVARQRGDEIVMEGTTKRGARTGPLVFSVHCATN